MSFLRSVLAVFFLALSVISMAQIAPLVSDVHAANIGTSLPVHVKMFPGDYITSPSGSSFLYLGTDGHLCLYAGSGPTNNLGNLACSSYFGSITDAYFVIVSTNSNVDIFDSTIGRIVWGCDNNSPSATLWLLTIDESVSVSHPRVISSYDGGPLHVCMTS